MPTAVERLASLLQHFLKLDGIDGRGAQAELARDFLKLDRAFSDLGNSDQSSSSFLKLEHKYGSALDGVGEAYLKLGGNFERDSFLGYLIGQAGLKIDTSATPASIDTSKLTDDTEAFSAGMLGAGQGLEKFGEDFLKLGQAETPRDFIKLEHTAMVDARGLKIEMQGLCDGSVRLADDLTPAGAPTGAVQSAGSIAGEDSALIALLNKLSHNFTTLEHDFGAIRGLFGGGGGAGAPAFDSAFSKLNADFLKLDSNLQGFADPLANMLLPAVRT